MSNLFICHSQAHLILASGLARGRFKNNSNHLILFRDFNLKDELREKLTRVFETCLFLEGTFPASENGSLRARMRWHREDNRLIKENVKQAYDRVFAVCDWTPPVQYALKRCYDLNHATEFAWLEDGILAYFPNAVIRRGADRYVFTMLLRKIYFKYIKGMGKIYDRDFDAMGGLSIFTKAYVLYSDAVREPYRSKKEIVGISDAEYIEGLNALYERRDLGIPDNSILLVMDKLDTYSYPEKVQNAIAVLKEDAEKAGQKIFCKFHPRENETWPIFDGCERLDNTIGAESLYLSLADQRDMVEVIGIKSAGLMSARKMGFKVKSLFNQCGEDNKELVNFFHLLSVDLI